MIWQVDVWLLLVLLASAVAALEARRLLTAVVVLSGYSFIMAVLFGALGAVDVALTEAALGAALTTVFYLAALWALEGRGKP